MRTFEERLRRVHEFTDTPRFKEITRLYSARDVAELQGAIQVDYTVAREAAEQFHARLRELFASNKSITTFGPYSPGQAVSMRRLGIEGIYLGGWATSAKGSITEDPGADLASYPLSQVPDEAAPIVRALLAADRNQSFHRARMSESERDATPEIDYRPFIIADADTGHGGDAHVRNLVRRFVEIGVPGYHIEDQKPGVKKCGHQGGKVLVPVDEQIRRLNAARLQLDIMGVPGLIVARTDAEAATYVESRTDERDHPFILGTTTPGIPSYKAIYVATLQRLASKGAEEVRGHLLYTLSDTEMAKARGWMESVGIDREVDDMAKQHVQEGGGSSAKLVSAATDRVLDAWQAAAGLKTLGEAVAAAMRFQESEGTSFSMSVDEFERFARTASHFDVQERAKSMGLDVHWDPAPAKTTEGYYQVRSGIPYAIAKSLAVAPFADILWMETKTADLKDAKEFADAIHAVYPDKMLAYNLSPSFNWDTTGMSEEEMKQFPAELGKLGFVFNFITYGGHQADGLAGEEFATALRQEGMLALAKLQRKLRLVESPYRTPQTHVGGPRLDAALMAASGRTASTKAMGKGSTQFQHLIQTEVPKTVLAEWLGHWCRRHDISEGFDVQLRPYSGYEVLELALMRRTEKVANIVFGSIRDRRGNAIISVRDQNTFDTKLRQKRLMTLMHLFLIHRYKANSVHYLTPTADNHHQTLGMKKLGIYGEVQEEVGQIIVANVNEERVQTLFEDKYKAVVELIGTSGGN
ncbi:MAG: isocitrate lyase ICL2 [Myxococcota bacterium]